MNDLIDRQAAIDVHCELCGDRDKCNCDICPDVEVFQLLPSAQPDEKRTEERTKTHACDLISRSAAIDFIDAGHLVNPNEPRWSDNEVVNFLKSRPSAQSEPKWIPWDSGKFPEESGTYTVTAYDGATKRVTYAKYQKRLKRWELTGARTYWRVLAWMPLPEPYKEGR